MSHDFLGDLSREEFLEKFWNKKPLLIKGAVKNASEFADFSDFHEMGQESEFETRMVIESGGEYPWQAISGPFTKKDFKKTGLWTLICHNLDLINSDFYDLKQNVSFIPGWHFDDIMATISKERASVGAHIDDYSVFILQGKGKRKWLLEENPVADYHPNLDIRLLKTFNPKIEWILEPGDMIYIPPNVAHHGISLSESISYSIGFKSIRYKDLLDQYITQIMCELDEASFQDQKTKLTKDSFLLENDVIEEVHNDLLKILNDKNKFKNGLLSYLSRPKNEILKNNEYSIIEIKDLLIEENPIKRDMWAKMVMAFEGEKRLISICSNQFVILEPTYQILSKMFSTDPDEEFIISVEDLKNDEFLNLLILFIQNGVFYFV